MNDDPKSLKPVSRWKPTAVLLLATTFLLSAIIYYFSQWHAYLVWLIANGFVLFGAFGLDKTAARFNWQRWPELTLHLLALTGGAWGGLLGMAVFRHKTRKWIFLLVLGAGLVLHGTIVWFVWQHTGF